MKKQTPLPKKKSRQSHHLSRRHESSILRNTTQIQAEQRVDQGSQQPYGKSLQGLLPPNSQLESTKEDACLACRARGGLRLLSAENWAWILQILPPPDEPDRCHCSGGAKQTPRHLILNCPKYSSEREAIFEALKTRSPPLSLVFNTEEGRNSLLDYLTQHGLPRVNGTKDSLRRKTEHATYATLITPLPLHVNTINQSINQIFP